MPPADSNVLPDVSQTGVTTPVVARRECLACLNVLYDLGMLHTLDSSILWGFSPGLYGAISVGHLLDDNVSHSTT